MFACTQLIPISLKHVQHFDVLNSNQKKEKKKRKKRYSVYNVSEHVQHETLRKFTSAFPLINTS